MILITVKGGVVASVYASGRHTVEIIDFDQEEVKFENGFAKATQQVAHLVKKHKLQEIA